MKKLEIFFIQPLIPHYRIPFFDRLADKFNIYVRYGRGDSSFETVDKKYSKRVQNIIIGKFEIFFVFSELIKIKPDIVVTYGEVKQLTNIILLLTRKLFGFKLIIWSHGFKDKKITIIDKLRLMEMHFSDGVIFYTKDCYKDATKYNLNNTFYLNNTLELKKNNNILQYDNKSKLKKKFNIKTELNGLFISRFSQVKAPELLLEIMKRIHEKNNNIGFIIIGDGACKPDFSNYDFIYDFGRIYEDKKKAVLFSLADFALMPRWIGLSVIESFVYKLPMFTLSNKLENIEHSVEYFYLKHNENSYIASDISELVEKIVNIDKDELLKLGTNACKLVNEELTMDNMVNNFCSFIEML